MKILFVGNSFAEDTANHAVDIAHSMGISDVKIGVLFFGGCPIEMHYEYLMTDAAAYTYHLNEGDGWSSTPEYKISDAVRSDAWDWIVIQHGTKNGNRYTSVECYEKLTPLVCGIREMLVSRAKFAFNLTWLGESTRQHHEILSYGADMALMRRRLEEVTREVILTNPNIDALIPTGTAIENARTSHIGLLTRDCYHLSMDKGRYIAALSLISTLSEIDPGRVSWAPDGVDEYAVRVAIESVRAAIESPLTVTKSAL